MPGKPISRTLFFTLLLLTLLAGLAAASRESLWIDEGYSAYFASQPDFRSFADAMRRETGSDAQTPFYIAYIWAWQKGFGADEHSLRLANLPWLLLGHAALLLAMSRAGMRRSIGVFFILAAAVSPFLSYYVNQGRCYVMQYGAACMLLAYLIEIMAAPERAWKLPTLLVGLSGAILLCGTSLLGVSFAGAAFLAAGWIIWKGSRAGIRIPRPAPSVVALLGLAIAGFALLGAYYLGTLSKGARATGGSTGLGSLLYCVYEMAGLAGLGPGRNDLRNLGTDALKTYGPQLAVGGAVVFGVLIFGGIVWLRRNAQRAASAGALGFAILPLAFTFGMGVAVHFRVLGRHLIALFPLLLLLIAFALDALWETRRRSLPALFLAVWACSTGLLRFSDVHRRDDYRSAAASVGKALASGKRVWWVADRRTAEYYGLHFVEKGNLRLHRCPSAADLAQEAEPDLIVLSKKETYDPDQAVQNYLARHGYASGAVFPAFTFFEKRR